jgi:hypothetical protein
MVQADADADRVDPARDGTLFVACFLAEEPTSSPPGLELFVTE